MVDEPNDSEREATGGSAQVLGPGEDFIEAELKRMEEETQALRETVSEMLTDGLALVFAAGLHGSDDEQAKDELNQLWRVLRSESDQGLVLICSAYVEDKLESLLRAALRGPEKLRSRILGPHGAAGTLSTQTDLARALGLISDEFAHELSLMRKIRNRVAHEWKADFGDDQVRAWCDALQFDPGSASDATRRRFLRSCLVVIGYLGSRASSIRKPPADPGFSLNKEKFAELTEEALHTIDDARASGPDGS